MIRLEGVRAGYGAHEVLRGVTGVVPDGLTALFGPNGTGKSTLFACMLGQLPYRGGLEVDGVEVRDERASELARRVAHVPQAHDIPFPITAAEMVTLGRTPHLASLRGPARADVERAYGALDQLGLLGLADQPYNTLSGGQRQLVLIARALAQDTRVLLLDEPTSSLDFGNQVLVWTVARALADAGRLVLVCTHDPNHVLGFADHVLALGREGRLVAGGVPDDVLGPGLLEEFYPGAGVVTEHPGRPVVVPVASDRAAAPSVAGNAQ